MNVDFVDVLPDAKISERDQAHPFWISVRDVLDTRPGQWALVARNSNAALGMAAAIMSDQHPLLPASLYSAYCASRFEGLPGARRRSVRRDLYLRRNA